MFMVSEHEVEEFMLKTFPTCPICEAKTGYDVSGPAKTFVQCKSCKAKWYSLTLPQMRKSTNFILCEPSIDGKGKTILKQTQGGVDFWKNLKNADIKKTKLSLVKPVEFPSMLMIRFLELR